MIDACGRNGVVQITLPDGTSISFSGSIVDSRYNQPIDYSDKVLDNRIMDGSVSPTMTKADSSEQLSFVLDDLALSDPLEYERIITEQIAEGRNDD